jgi:hypothetical protein
VSYLLLVLPGEPFMRSFFFDKLELDMTFTGLIIFY